LEYNATHMAALGSSPLGSSPLGGGEFPRPVGDTVVAPAELDPEQQDLGRRLDVLFSMNGRTERPSDWLGGAKFVSQERLRANADWVAQATHSLREILYRLLSPKMDGGAKTIREFLTNYGSAQDLDVSVDRMGRMWDKLCDVSHHKKRLDEIEEGDFETLLAAFEKVMREALERQLDVHGTIDVVALQPPE
jgi:hypothetical protein